MKPKLKCPQCGKRIGEGLPMANHAAAHEAEEALAKRMAGVTGTRGGRIGRWRNEVL